MYVGLSVRTQSPASRKILLARSSGCCEPVVMRISSAVQSMPRLRDSAAKHSRSGAKPSLGPYCKAPGPPSRSTRSQAVRTSSTGKSSGAGRPPAKEMISACSVTLRISRIVEGRMALMRRANRVFMPLSCFSFWIALIPNTACACRISLAGIVIDLGNPYALSAGRVRLPAQAHKKIEENFILALTRIFHSTIHRYTRYKAMAIQRALPAKGDQPDRWEAQLRKGAVEMAALASLWQGRLYGLEIIRFLESQSQLALAEGTIYPILNRLKAEGMLTSEWVEAEAGHPRKYYSLTDAGRQRLRQMAEAWVGFAGGLSRLLEPVLHPADQDPSAGTPVLKTQEITQ